MQSTKKKKKKRIRDRRIKVQTLPAQHTPGLFQKIDGRTNLARHLRSSYLSVADDLGGEDNLSVIQRNTIERYVFLNTLIQSWELQFAEDPEGNEALIGKLVQATNARKGLANDLGLTKKLSNSSKTLQAIARDNSR